MHNPKTFFIKKIMDTLVHIWADVQACFYSDLIFNIFLIWFEAFLIACMDQQIPGNNFGVVWVIFLVQKGNFTPVNLRR